MYNAYLYINIKCIILTILKHPVQWHQYIYIIVQPSSIFVSPAQSVKNLPAVQETQVQSLGGKDPLEKGMATHSSTLAWRIPWTEEPGRIQSMGSQSMGLPRVGHD